MNLVVGSPTWLIIVLIILLLAAAVEDALRLRISNYTCLAIFLAGSVAGGMHGFPSSLWQNAAVCAAILAIGIPLFAAGWMGGGDIKLLAAVGLWFDLRTALGLVAAIFIVGGLLALIYIVSRRLAGLGRRSSLRDGKIPYGLAIVSGALFVIGTQLGSGPSNPYVERLRATEAARR